MEERKRLRLPRIATVPEEGSEWVLLESYDFTVPEEFGGGLLHLPYGLRTDLASVPKLLWPVIAPFHLANLAPIVHDLLYGCRGAPPRFISPDRMTLDRKGVDDLFLWLMKTEGVSGPRRTAAYSGVRAMGWASWGKRELRVDVPMAEQIMGDECAEEEPWPEH